MPSGYTPHAAQGLIWLLSSCCDPRRDVTRSGCGRSENAATGDKVSATGGDSAGAAIRS